MSGTSMPSGSPCEASLRELVEDQSRRARRGCPSRSGIAPRIGGTHARQSRLGQPGAVELVVARGGAEVPQDRVVPARDEREADVLVALPRPDRGARHVAEVVRVEEQERAELGCLERRLRTCRAEACAAGRSRPAAPSRPPFVAPRDAMFMALPSPCSVILHIGPSGVNRQTTRAGGRSRRLPHGHFERTTRSPACRRARSSTPFSRPRWSGRIRGRTGSRSSCSAATSGSRSRRSSTRRRTTTPTHAVIRDQEEAGLDIVTDGNMWYDDYVGVIGSFCWYMYERIGGFEPAREEHPLGREPRTRRQGRSSCSTTGAA